MNYIQKAKADLAKRIDVEDDLLDLYVLLVFVHGQKTTWEHVHDAWSIWQTNLVSDHDSLHPFKELKFEIQELDAPYADAIRETAKIFNPIDSNPLGKK